MPLTLYTGKGCGRRTFQCAGYIALGFIGSLLNLSILSDRFLDSPAIARYADYVYLDTMNCNSRSTIIEISKYQHIEIITYYWFPSTIASFLGIWILESFKYPQTVAFNLKRKVYHILMVAIVAPFMLSYNHDIDLAFLQLSLTIAILVFIILEYLRSKGLLPPILTEFLRKFGTKSEKEKYHITAHIFLLSGISLPIIAHPYVK